MLQTPHHPFNNDDLNTGYSWLEYWHTRYFHTAGENTLRKPCCMKANAPTWICGHSQVFVGRQCSPNHYQPPSSAVNFTRPFGGDHHGHNDVYAAKTRHYDGCHLCRYCDCIYEFHKLGAHPYDGGLPHSHPWGCHQIGVRTLSADTAIST